MKILRCNEVAFSDVYLAFKEGFSDYSIKFEMNIEQFESHFFGPEANKLLFSYIAYEQESPVGLILGGCMTYEGVLTLRCGTMCVHPEFRRVGIASKLISAHEKLAKDLGCTQLFLECISDNDKAVVFYNAVGYEAVYQLKYFTKEKHKEKEDDTIQLASLADYKFYREKSEGHVNWQNEIWYLEYKKPSFKMIVFHDEVVAMIGYKDNKICYLHVKKEHRQNSYGKRLINSVECDKCLKISFSSQGGLHGFVKAVGFIEDPINQIEMYKYL